LGCVGGTYQDFGDKNGFEDEIDAILPVATPTQLGENVALSQQLQANLEHDKYVDDDEKCCRKKERRFETPTNQVKVTSDDENQTKKSESYSLPAGNEVINSGAVRAAELVGPDREPQEITSTEVIIKTRLLHETPMGEYSDSFKHRSRSSDPSLKMKGKDNSDDADDDAYEDGNATNAREYENTGIGAATRRERLDAPCRDHKSMYYEHPVGLRAVVTNTETFPTIETDAAIQTLERDTATSSDDVLLWDAQSRIDLQRVNFVHHGNEEIEKQETIEHCTQDVLEKLLDFDEIFEKQEILEHCIGLECENTDETKGSNLPMVPLSQARHDNVPAASLAEYLERSYSCSSSEVSESGWTEAHDHSESSDSDNVHSVQTHGTLGSAVVIDATIHAAAHKSSSHDSKNSRVSATFANQPKEDTPNNKKTLDGRPPRKKSTSTKKKKKKTIWNDSTGDSTDLVQSPTSYKKKKKGKKEDYAKAMVPNAISGDALGITMDDKGQSASAPSFTKKKKDKSVEENAEVNSSKQSGTKDRVDGTPAVLSPSKKKKKKKTKTNLKDYAEEDFRETSPTTLKSPSKKKKSQKVPSFG
jgi:hypothetical protein